MQVVTMLQESQSVVAYIVGAGTAINLKMPLFLGMLSPQDSAT